MRKATFVVALVAMLGLPAWAAPASQPAGAAKAPTSQAAGLSKADVDALIAQAGKTKPEWFDEVELKFPDTLDLTWSNEGNKDGWQPQKKLGAYMFSVIGSNPKRYREGVKLLHHVVVVNQKDPGRFARSMDALGWAYYDLLQDYGRAVYWWQRAAKAQPGRFSHPLPIARCYFRLGSKQAAVEMIGRYGRDNTRRAELARLWAEMGETQRALTMAEATAREGMPDVAYLAAGDICRETGEYRRAMDYYRKVMAVTETFGRDLKRNKERAERNLEGIQVMETLDLTKVKDGTYSGSATGYIGNVTVELAVRGGRIESVRVTQTKEDRPLLALTDVPAKIVAQQGLKGVDVCSGATITSDAIINATGKALLEAMK